MNDLENKSEEEVLNSTPKTKEKNVKTNEVKKDNFGTKLWRAIKKRPLVFVLLFLLIVVLVGATIKIGIDKNRYNSEKTEIIEKYEIRIDSLILKNIQFTSTVFSWSIRSEMMRKNEENLSQLVTVFIKESDTDLVQIVDLETNTILISSDKKYEGEKFIIPMKIDFNEQKTIPTDKKTTVYTPIMGFNNLIGLLVVENTKVSSK